MVRFNTGTIREKLSVLRSRMEATVPDLMTKSEGRKLLPVDKELCFSTLLQRSDSMGQMKPVNLIHLIVKLQQIAQIAMHGLAFGSWHQYKLRSPEMTCLKSPVCALDLAVVPLLASR